jgi:hypothetical protein
MRTVGGDRPDERCQLVAGCEVLADQRHQRELGDLDELHRQAGNLHRLPPLDIRMQDSAQVILEDLTLIQRPPVMLVLPDVKPRPRCGRHRSTLLKAWIDSPVQPVARQPAGLRAALADARIKEPHPMAIEQSLQRADLVLADRALGQHDHIDAVDLLASSDQNPVQQVQIQSLRGGKLEEAIGFLGQPLHRPGHRAEVRLSDPHRPRQQQQVRELRGDICTAVAGGHLVPAGRNPRSLHARVASECDHTRWRRDHLGQHPHEARLTRASDPVRASSSRPRAR